MISQYYGPGNAPNINAVPASANITLNKYSEYTTKEAFVKYYQSGCYLTGSNKVERTCASKLTKTMEYVSTVASNMGEIIPLNGVVPELHTSFNRVYPVVYKNLYGEELNINKPELKAITVANRLYYKLKDSNAGTI